MFRYFSVFIVSCIAFLGAGFVYGDIAYNWDGSGNIQANANLTEGNLFLANETVSVTHLGGYFPNIGFSTPVADTPVELYELDTFTATGGTSWSQVEYTATGTMLARVDIGPTTADSVQNIGNGQYLHLAAPVQLTAGKQYVLLIGDDGAHISDKMDMSWGLTQGSAITHLEQFFSYNGGNLSASFFDGPAWYEWTAASGRPQQWVAGPDLIYDSFIIPSVMISPENLTVEEGEDDYFTVELDISSGASAPTENVDITVNPDDSQGVVQLNGSAAGDSIVLTFTPGNWDTPKTVTVHSMENGLEEGNKVIQVDFSTSSNDSNYNNLVVGPISVTVTDDDYLLNYGDINGDGLFNLADVLLFSEQWLDPPGCAGHPVDCADFENNDGVNLVDYARFSKYWPKDTVIINEIHYDPDVKVEHVEFVELYNIGGKDVDISGWQFCNGINYTFPAGAILGSDGYVVVAYDPCRVASKFGISPSVVYGPFEGKLSNDGETIELCTDEGLEYDRVDYQLGFPWPTVGDQVSVDGDGSSIQLVYPLADNDLAGSWRSGYPTPGTSNGAVYAVNIAPHIRQVKHLPKQPASGEVVTITCKVTDPDGVASVTLEYQIVTPGNYIRYQYFNGSTRVQDPAFETGWNPIAMHDDGINGDDIGGDDIYTVEIPGSVQVHRHLIRYRITVEDTGARSIKVPYADDPQPNFAYFVYDGVPAWTGADRPGVTSAVMYPAEVMNSLPIYHLISKQSEVEDCQYNPTFIEEYNWTGAMVYDGVVYDHIWYRNRGNWAIYTYGKNKWKYTFNRGHFFQARDNYGNKYKEKWDRMNYSSCISYWHYNGNNRGESGMFEALNFKLFNLTGVPSSNTHWVHYRVIDDATEAPSDQYEGDFWGMYLVLEQPDGHFLDEHDLPDGNFYKRIGSSQGNKTNQGPTQVTNHSDLSSFISGYHSRPALSWWKQNFTLDRYYSYRAVLEGVHHYDIWDAGNHMLYHNPETNQWWMMPWDIDLSWDQSSYYCGSLKALASNVRPLTG